MRRTALLLLLLTPLSLASDQSEDVHGAIEEGNARVDSMLALEQSLQAAGLTADRRRSVPRGTQQARESSLNAARILAASSSLKEKLNWSADEARRKLPLISLERTALNETCPDATTCPSGAEKYAPIDGSCHNRLQPGWGKANTPYQRVLPNAYADGVFEPRKAISGAELRSPREVSRTFIKPAGSNDARYTLALMSWGQFITHDVTKATSFTSADGKAPVCCNTTSGGFLDSNYLHPFCLPITIPSNDTFYSYYNQTCMQFVRTNIGADFGCTMGHAEQLNGITHWLDASMIYGSSQAELDGLRTGQDGLLKSTLSAEGKELLPLRPSCSDPTCYYAGDERAQENPQLATFHTLMMREHNRLARALKTLNPDWDDETLFQEARRIVIAEIQHITYSEYLPALLGPQAMNDYNLVTAPTGKFATYTDRQASNPAIWNEFAAAVYRVGHSQVQGTLRLYDAQDQELTSQSFLLSNYYFNASMLPTAGFIDNAIRGLTKQPPLTINPEYTGELTNRLNKGSKEYGLDLVALNIQRGREHGIPDYNTVRVHCGLPKARTFDDLLNEITNDTLASLKASYASVDDIDLYIGCLAEATKPVNGSLLGATGLCIVAKQFGVTKHSDRFFYDVGNQSSSFSLAQMDQIRKTSLARIFCSNNNGDVTKMQPKAFVAPDDATNARVSCSSISSIDLTPWQVPRKNRGTSLQTSGVLALHLVSAVVASAMFYKL